MKEKNVETESGDCLGEINIDSFSNLTVAPTNELISFHNPTSNSVEDESIGKIFINDDNKLAFEGDLDESVTKFFELLKGMVDNYIEYKENK